MPASHGLKLSWQPTVPLLLGVNGGFVDTAGFLALQGLFTAHVTGNFVTLGAAVVFGTSGTAAKILALPTFCAVILLARLARFCVPAVSRSNGWNRSGATALPMWC